jgi:menaquinol-cytochrome c reductase iron-sulfur subunit
MSGPNRISRRDFIKGTTAAIGGFIAVVLGVPAVAYMIDPARKSGGKESSVKVGKLEEIPVGTPYPFSFTLTKVNGWERTSTTFSGYVLRSSKDPQDLLILSSRCTHLGCQVTWHDDKQAYICPCHDAHFNKTGGVIDGPPPRPLDRFPVFNVDGDGNLIVLVKEA